MNVSKRARTVEDRKCNTLGDENQHSKATVLTLHKVKLPERSATDIDAFSSCAGLKSR